MSNEIAFVINEENDIFRVKPWERSCVNSASMMIHIFTLFSLRVGLRKCYREFRIFLGNNYTFVFILTEQRDFSNLVVSKLGELTSQVVFFDKLNNFTRQVHVL